MPCNCDGRYPHYIRESSLGRQVNRVVCVDVSGEITEVAEQKLRRIETFKRWHAIALSRHNGKLGPIHNASGTNVKEFWRSLEYELRHPGKVWVISFRCSRIWSLLGLVELLGTGYTRISGGSYRAIRSNPLENRASTPGLFVVEDPPNIAQLRIGAKPGQLMWVDIRNYAIELHDEIPSGDDTVRELADIWIKLDRIVKTKLGIEIATTAASTAMRTYKSRLITTTPHCHVHPVVNQLEKEAHIGGRCEAFRLGKIPYKCYHYDFRSHYGGIMADELMPVRLCYLDQKPMTKAAEIDALLGHTMAMVTIETNEAAYPYRREGDIIYPIGRFTTTLCGPELADAVRHKRIVRWHITARYEMARELESFARLVYSVREQADKDNDEYLSSFAKQVLVSMPGKLGEKIKQWIVEPRVIAPEPFGEWQLLNERGKLERWRAIASVMQRERIGGYSPDAVPAMACWIAAHGRYRLLQAIRTAGKENVVYVDTDSLFTSSDGLVNKLGARNSNEKVLGCLESRGAFGSLCVWGIKHYTYKGVTKFSGQAKGFVVQSADGKGYWRVPAIPASSACKGFVGTEAEYIENPPPAEYRHGIVCKNGIVMPHEINEDITHERKQCSVS